MKTTRYIRTAIICCIVFLSSSIFLKAQEGCSNFNDTSGIPFCQCTDCGDIDPVWETVGTSTICEGSPFQLTGESSSSNPAGLIEDYNWYFIDVATGDIIDQFVYTTPQIPPYTYVLQSSSPPACNQTSVFITVVLITTSPTCAEGESCRRAVKDLEILLEPRANFDISPQVCEQTPITFTNQSCYATNFTWDFGDGSPTSNLLSPSHTYQTPGTYTVTLTASNENCTGEDIATRTIEVVGFPSADYTYMANPMNQCEPVIIDFTSISNQWSTPSWSISPFDTLAWCLTDTTASLSDDNITVDFKKCGKYEVVASFNGACFTNVSFTQSGTATVIASSPCGQLTETVDIIIGSTEPITFPAINPATLCPVDTIIQFESSPSGLWSPPSIITSDGEVNPSDLAPGNYTVSVSAGSTECPNTASTTFTVLEDFNISLIDAIENCDQVIVNPANLNLTSSGVDNYDWTFINGSPASFNGMNFPTITFNTSGSIILNASGICGATVDTVEVLVVPNTGVAFGLNPDTLCNTSSAIQLEAP